MIAADRERFEELEAGRILGDLEETEWREWEDLTRAHKVGPDLSLELVAAAVQAEMIAGKEAPLPKALDERLRAEIPAFLGGSSADDASAPPDNIVQPSRWGLAFSSPALGWAVAAVFALLLVLNLSSDPNTTAPSAPSLAESRDALEENADDLLRTTFSGLTGYDGAGGDLVWSDEFQEGYMTLTNLPSNDRSKNQYQLWIVDPSRDDEPVDGGVFDIPSAEGPVVIKIDNPVAVSSPKAFLITLEKPGGVVVSDQEVKVALATTS